MPHVTQSGSQKWVTNPRGQGLGIEGWGVGVVTGWVSDFFIVIFNFSITKLVSMLIFSLIGAVFNFGGVKHGRGQGLGFRFFHGQI